MTDFADKKPEKKEENGCTVYVTVYCDGDKKKDGPKAVLADERGKGYDCDDKYKPAPAPKCQEGCKVYVTVFCSGDCKK